jgi:hypothetical protein
MGRCFVASSHATPFDCVLHGCSQLPCVNDSIDQRSTPISNEAKQKAIADGKGPYRVQPAGGLGCNLPTRTPNGYPEIPQRTLVQLARYTAK